MKKLLSAMVMSVVLAFATSCTTYEGDPVAEQESPILYVLTVTNLKPTTQDLFVERSNGAVPASPGTVTVYLRRVPSTATELDLTSTCFFMYALKTKPTVLVPAVQGVDYTAVITGV
jgi:hypothetical protein